MTGTGVVPTSERGPTAGPEKPVSQARHEARCGICSHPERLAIERTFLYREMSVADISKRYGVGHDAVYRHSNALNLLSLRYKNWRAIPESDNDRPPDHPRWEASNTVFRAREHSTPHARAIIELLQIPASDELLKVVERAIEIKAATENASADAAANAVFVAAALVKNAAPPDCWLTWFQHLER